MTRNKKKLTIRVLFDTSVVYTGLASDLFRKEIVELFTNHSSHSDIEIVWHLPDIVVNERRFQMNKKGNELLPSIQKLERLLGHNLNINKQIISDRVDDAIKKQLDQWKVQTRKTDSSKVEWESIIHSAVNRKPPFEDSDKEKGFRDALILECLKQLIKECPTTKSICRIIFISNDGLLKEAAMLEAQKHNNVNIFSDIEEFISLINILTSEITEEIINSISDEASKLFFIKDDKNTLYFTEGIRKKISEDFVSKLDIKQEGADKRENGTWWINKPGFEKKDKQKVFWKTIIDVDFENFKTTSDGNSVKALLEFWRNKEITEPYLSTSPLGNKKEKIGEGKTRFEVMWSVTLTTNKKLKNPKIEDIKYVDTIYK